MTAGLAMAVVTADLVMAAVTTDLDMAAVTADLSTVPLKQQTCPNELKIAGH